MGASAEHCLDTAATDVSGNRRMVGPRSDRHGHSLHRPETAPRKVLLVADVRSRQEEIDEAQNDKCAGPNSGVQMFAPMLKKWLDVPSILTKYAVTQLGLRLVSTRPLLCRQGRRLPHLLSSARSLL